LGWKTKRQVHIDAYEQALAAANDGMLDTLAALQRQAQVRQARIFMQTYAQARKNGKREEVARNQANNELTRSKLTRVDGKKTQFKDRRGREVWVMEQAILARTHSKMTEEEREQMDMTVAHEKTQRKKSNKLV
jgi:hypothetical protein